VETLPEVASKVNQEKLQKASEGMPKIRKTKEKRISKRKTMP